MEALPSQTHLRGFLRLYAATLGVDLDELIAISNIADARNSKLNNRKRLIKFPLRKKKTHRSL